MLLSLGDDLAVVAVGLFGGIVLGLASRLGRFCTLGAIEDHMYGGDSGRLRMWGVAIGTAILGTFGASLAGLVDPTATIYLGVATSLTGAAFGGAIFGYGMALAGNCGFGALARLGGGDMRSFVIVLVMGMAAYATMSGPLATLRLAVFPVTPDPVQSPGLAHALGRLTGLAPEAMGLLIGLAVLAVALSGGRNRGRALFWGGVVGLAVVSGFVGTAWIGTHGFSAVRPMSHTFSAPLGETMLYVMISSGNVPGFGVGSVVGVLIGAAIGSSWRGHFRWEACDDPRELRRQILGAALMGSGAVIAAGCSVGQGLSAMAVLAYSAPLTLAAIWLGATVGLRQLIEGGLPAE